MQSRISLCALEISTRIGETEIHAFCCRNSYFNDYYSEKENAKDSEIFL